MLCCILGNLALGRGSWGLRVGRGTEGHLLITMQFTALREEWMAGYTVMLENGPRQLNPSCIAVTGKGYSIYVTDMAGKKRQTLLQPYSKS